MNQIVSQYPIAFQRIEFGPRSHNNVDLAINGPLLNNSNPGCGLYLGLQGSILVFPD